MTAAVTRRETSSSGRSRSTVARGHETLVRIERDQTVTVLDDDLTLSNGLAWSADGTLLYSVDSVPGTVWIRSYDAVTGVARPRREWLRVADGIPDGICMDAEGHLWVAIWGAGQVRRYAPGGRLAGIVDVPAPHTSSVAFVGDGLRPAAHHYGDRRSGAEQLAAFPDSGRLFLADVGVTGLPVTAWSGAGRQCGPSSSPGQARPRSRTSRRPATAGEVVVDVERAGVCGTDMEFFTGEMSYLHTGQAQYPMRIGHEWTGTVSVLGDGVEPVLARAPGDRRHDDRLRPLRPLPDRPAPRLRRPV